jgi:outer membrane receptor protein involved in Fe transport
MRALSSRIHIPLGILALIVSLIPARAEAFEGRVIDRQSGRAIAGAQVGIGGLAGTVTTGADGRFVWEPDPPTPFVVLVILPGGSLARPVRIVERSDNAPLIIYVEPVLAETVVVAGAAPSVDAPAGSSTTLVSALDIARRSPATLMQALENVPGVSSVAEGQSAVPAIRGLARGRTLVILDGTRLFSERRAGPSVSFLAPDNLDRIDVVRGPASVAYGSDAFGGVVSLITHRPAPGAGTTAQAAATYGIGASARRFEAQLASGLGPRAGLIVEARQRTADDYSSPDGRVLNSTWQDQGGLIRVAVKAGGLWAVSWQGDSVHESGLPRSDYATLHVSMPFERSERLTASFERSGVPGLGHVSVIGLFGQYEQRIDQDRVAAPGRPRRIDRADIDGNDVEIRGVARTALGRVRLTAGADLTDRHDLHAHDIGIVFNASGVVTSTTDNTSIASATRRNMGAFGQIDAPIGSHVTATIGGRFDHVRSTNVAGYFGDRIVSHDAVSGSAAVAYRPWEPVILTVQASRGFRDPSLSDRFFRGPVGRGFITGNPDLSPERSLQFDVTARYDAGRWRASAAYYHYDIADLIERYQSGADTFLFRNRGLAEVRGVELEGSVEIVEGTTIDASGTIGRGRAREDDAALDDIAPATAILQIRQTFGTRVLVSLRLAALARDASPGPSEVMTPGYVNAGVATRWQASRWFDLRFAAGNLFNQRYYSSPGSRGVLAPGRDATMTFIVRY